jgi:prepilin-type processing-associated H-X9-DG protein
MIETPGQTGNVAARKSALLLQYAAVPRAAISSHRWRLIVIASIVTCSAAASWVTWDRVSYRLLGRSGCGSPRIKCASNLKQIGLALQIYSNENGKRFPPSFDPLIEDIVTADLFICPQTSDQAAVGPTTQAVVQDFHKPGRNSYVFVAGGAADQSEPSLVLVYEPIGLHGPGMNVLYGDGHVGWVPLPEASRVIAELQAGFNPPRPATTQPSGR